MSLNLNVPFLYGLSDCAGDVDVRAERFEYWKKRTAALIEHIQLWMLASSGSSVILCIRVSEGGECTRVTHRKRVRGEIS